jgi:DNA invertase Pin-like site-specific DNA recombinase
MRLTATSLKARDGRERSCVRMTSKRRSRFSAQSEPYQKLAAEYVRMSTEHQQYSTENQHAAIQRFADEHGLAIVRTFADAGKSGLGIQGREALQELLRVVNSGSADFSTILVYDVSRWGRFQDADEAAHYEFQCKRQHISVQYCAEHFSNDATPMSAVIKSLKRAMAGEYSRELSTKVFAGQCRLVTMGYRQGGVAGYGLRRLLLDQNGNPKATLARGERKSLQTERVILTPGPEEELAIVRRIYHVFTHERRTESEIAAILNTEGISNELGQPWSRGAIHELLTNEKYIGNNLYNRSSTKLQTPRIANPPDKWVRHDGAFAPIVDPDIFAAAQAIIRDRDRYYTDDELLGMLRKLLQERGSISGIVIDECDGMPSSSTYRQRFQGLLRAYSLAGFRPAHDYEYLRINCELRRRYQDFVQQLIVVLQTVASVDRDPATDLLTINGEFSVSVVLARCSTTAGGRLRWNIRLDAILRPDITIAVRMTATNDDILDYYLLPMAELTTPRLRLAEENGLSLDPFRFDSLDLFTSLVRRSSISEAA